MSDEASQAAAFQLAYAAAVREYEEQQQQQFGGNQLSSAAAATASLPFNFAVDSAEVQYLMSMEEQASMMLMERLGTDRSQAVTHNNNNNIVNNNNNNNPLQMNEVLLQELIGLAGGHPGTDEAMTQQLLALLEQQKQQESLAFENVSEPPTLVSNRLEKHFFTVAQDGTYN
jgi:cytochrome P450